MKIKLLAEEYDVELVNPHEINDLAGMIDYTHGKIKIDKDSSPGRRAITAMHEILHWFNARFNLWNDGTIADDEEELLLDRMATVFVFLLPEINRLIEWVRKAK